MNGKLIDGVYHYAPEWLEEFHRRGREHGDAGFIPVSFDGKYMKYEGYGTIESPCTELHYMTMIYNPLFDGPLERGSNAPNELYFSFEIMDFGKL